MTDFRSAAIYQIYPRSFNDGNGDGIGDLPGITARLDYIKNLGIDAVWISPFFKSPMKDFGYDVSDYYAVDPIFGTDRDFTKLLAHARELNIDIIIDLVLNHTSNEHPWFTQSRADKTNPHANWYVWRDAKPDGSPPNNWVSVFGGPAWTFDFRRGQYYLHHFLKEQPSLNVRNPAVQDALLDVARHYLAMGVTGLRLDVINFLMHDPQYRDNPACALTARTQYDGVDPYNMQSHIHDKSHPDNMAFIRRLRAVCNEYPGAFLMGEIGDDDSIARMVEYTAAPDVLHTAYHLGFGIGQSARLHPDLFIDTINRVEQAGIWPCWALSNHDLVRAATRFGARAAPFLMGLLLTLRGTPIIYQGEELGLPDAVIPYDQIQDPWGKALYPQWQGRDGCRTPMPWTDVKPDKSWLPVPDTHLMLAVSKQESDPHSMLALTRQLLALRQNSAALSRGDFSWLKTGETRLSFTRRTGDETVECTFDFDTLEFMIGEYKFGPLAPA